jgi:hypothetical protein
LIPLTEILAAQRFGRCVGFDPQLLCQQAIEKFAAIKSDGLLQMFGSCLRSQIAEDDGISSKIVG